MRAAYKDITKRIKDAPKWYDENGVPRYDEFHPDDTPSIYAHEAVLYRIECQFCGRPFDVAEDWSMMDGLRFNLHIKDPAELAIEVEKTRPSERLRTGQGLDYGDPPRHDNCVGDTMSSVPRRVLQFWHKPAGVGPRPNFDWARRPELEIPIEEEWAQ